MTQNALERAVFCAELPPCPTVSLGLVPAPVWAPWEGPALQEALQSGVTQVGGTCGVFANSLHGSERVLTSGELFLCSLQLCTCPQTDRSVQIPGFTDNETPSKSMQGETFVKWIFLAFLSVHPWGVEVGYTVTCHPHPCPDCLEGALAAPRRTEAPLPLLSNAAWLGCSRSPEKMKR